MVSGCVPFNCVTSISSFCPQTNKRNGAQRRSVKVSFFLVFAFALPFPGTGGACLSIYRVPAHAIQKTNEKVHASFLTHHPLSSELQPLY